jgi:hypothetical protein
MIEYLVGPYEKAENEAVLQNASPTRRGSTLDLRGS